MEKRKEKTKIRTYSAPAGARERGGRRRHTSNRRASGRRRMEVALPSNGKMHENNKTVPVPPLKEGVRVVPLGGVEEVGKNMTAVETSDDIFVVDAGFQFIAEYDTPGVDYILPNTKYLEERKDKVRAVLITHAHLDHIGGIPYILDRIGNPPIYTRYLTSVMIKKRQEEFPNLPQIDIKVLEPGERVKIGKTYVSSFPVTHSIPDSMGFIIETKLGNVILTGDLKLNHKDGDPTDDEKKNWSRLSKMNNLLFIADSTNAEKPGFSITEYEVHQNIEKIIKGVKGRLIVGTFASQFERMVRIIQIAEECNKKVVTEGRSIKTNIEIAKQAGIFSPKKDSIIEARDIDKYPAEKIIVLATGAQGEEFAALMRMAVGRHRTIRLNERDTVVLSSSVIPGNELAVQKLKDNLYRHNVKILHYRVSDVHSTGHGNAGELAWINKQVGARFFMPAYGYHSMLRCHAQAVIDTGFPKENIIVPDNGTVIDFTDDRKFVVRKEKAPSNLMMVDGFSIGDAQEVVIRDRQTLAQDGMCVVIAIINLKTGKLRKSPDIISRGFVYLRESQELLQQTRLITKKTVEDIAKDMNPINFDYIKRDLTDAVASFLFQKTNKRPIVIPVILGV